MRPPPKPFGEKTKVPAFIAMEGEWVSVALCSDPPELLANMPHWSVPHKIMATPRQEGLGVEFSVEQTIDGVKITTLISYVFDPKVQRSFGVFSSSKGPSFAGGY